MDFTQSGADWLCRNRPPNPPAGDGIGLRYRTARNSAFEHPRQAGDVGMLERCIDNMLVNFIGQHKSVIFLGEIGNNLQFNGTKDLTGWVCRVAQDQRPASLIKSPAEIIWVERQAGWMEWYMKDLGSQEA